MVMTNSGWTPTQDSTPEVSISTHEPISPAEIAPLDAVTPDEEVTELRVSPKGAPGSKLRALGIWTKRTLAMVFVLAILGTAGISVWALVQGSWSVNPVLSGSMRPGFTVGGVVISQRTPVSKLAVRDVIVFRNPNKPSQEMVHRIVQITKGSDGQLLIKTQGDANRVRDPWTLSIRGNSVYKVRWSLPLLGYAAVAYQNHRGIASLVAGFLLILVALSIVIRQRRSAKAPPAPDDGAS